jgi:hypothetical protein
MMNIPVLGLVENYSYLECPDCGKHINLFGESHIDEIAKEYDLPILGKMPLDPKNAVLADAGKIYENDNTYLNPAVEVLKGLEEM